jgi:hypothetical protein
MADNFLHERLRITLQHKGLPDNGSLEDCIQRLSETSSTRSRKRKYYPGKGYPVSDMKEKHISSKLCEKVDSMPSKLRAAIALHVGLKADADSSHIASALLE